MFSVAAMRASLRAVVVLAAASVFLSCGGGGGGKGGAPQPPGDPQNPPDVPNQPPLQAPPCNGARSAWPSGRDAGYRSPIAAENALAGDPTWQSGARPAYDAARKRFPFEAFASRASAKAGDTVEVKVHSDDARDARWVLYRLGWYGGAGARRVAEGTATVGPQPACPMEAGTGLVRCAWTTTFSIPITAAHVSGYYAVKVLRDAGAAAPRVDYVAWAPLVVVDERPADLLLQAGVNTWQAYNDYGGESLYVDESGTLSASGGKALKVSFDRPFRGTGLPSRFLRYETPFARWLERIGYDVAYTTTNDLAIGGCPEIARAGMYLQVGHDEYTPGALRDALEHARDAGVPLAFFSGNPLYWKVRIEDPAGPRNPRTVTVYKSNPSADPDPADQTGRWRDAPVSRPENALLGAMYESWQVVSYPLVVANAAGWLFRDTGLANGDVLPFLVGHEYDRRYANGAEPAGVTVELRSPVLDAEGVPGTAEAVSYRAPSGALVFAAATIQWAYGVDDSATASLPAADPRLERMTMNVFEEAIGVAPPRPPQTAARSAPASDGAWAASVTTVATGLDSPAGIAALRDGTLAVALPRLHQIVRVNPATGAVTPIAGQRGVIGTVDPPSVPLAQAKFRAPTAVVELPDGALAVADTGNHAVRRVDLAAGTVSTIAGKIGALGFADGAAATARFRFPMGLAVDAAGTLYVADNANHRIRALAGGQVTTVAGSGVAGVTDGPAASATLFYPTAVAVAADGTVYALSTTRLRAIAGGQVTTVAGGSVEGFADGLGAAARMAAYGGLALAGGALWFADAPSFRLRRAALADGRVQTAAGAWTSARVDGTGDVARFGLPVGVAAAPDGALYVSDAAAGAIRAVRP